MSRLRRLRRLAWKYEQLVALRERREAVEVAGADCFPPAEGASRKAAFRRIAREFPGALRELDTVPAALLREREARVRAACERCAAGDAPADPFVELALDFHLTLRETLLVKRWLATRPAGTSAERLAAFTVRLERIRSLRARLGLAGEAAPADLAAWLELRHRPPRGRLLDLVWSELEARHGAPRAALEAALFSA
ncbi:hypothetical protein [Vulgatibacter sp.]|uniref:hypothetical protein n=1 Tax=Vulgatibacter sp. TaxID=1971226 RepID=UPI00356989D0